MFPLRDNIPCRTTPYVNYAIIAICSVVFFFQLQEQPNAPSMVERYGMIPARITHPDAEVMVVDTEEKVMTPQGVKIVQGKRPAAPSAVPPWLTLLTCVFLHGGWLHILGNMWFLFIFGDNVEDRFGHLGYAIFYLVCGVAASGIHYLSEMTSTMPTIGASGAIAGVMGAYFIWYPRAQVQAILPIFVFLQVIVLPAPLFLGVWFLLQFVQGASITGAESGGVAWWAHIGGFATGVGIALILGRSSLVRPSNPSRLADTNTGRPFRIRR